ncbi:hypothetical protein J6590_108320 [Homalodisca vitripennis]|nr:hypothetical protein J6590_108320 [Homalodisca vitripennis]
MSPKVVGNDENLEKRCSLQTIKRRRNIKQKRNFNISVSLYSDSHGRGLNQLLDKKFNSKTTLLKPSSVLPGAPIEEIVKSVSADKEYIKENEFLICIAGTNNMDRPDKNIRRVVEAYETMLESFPKVNFLVSTVPTRFDLSPYCRENINIRTVNKHFKELAFNFPNMKLVNLGSKHRHLFRGMHFNHAGKKNIANDIFHIIEKWAVQKRNKATTPSRAPDPVLLSVYGPSGLQTGDSSFSSLTDFPPLPGRNDVALLHQHQPVVPSSPISLVCSSYSLTPESLLTAGEPFLSHPIPASGET